jgi:arylsulfatase
MAFVAGGAELAALHQQIEEALEMRNESKRLAVWACSLLALAGDLGMGQAIAATDRPNIMFIMADDIGIMNVGAHHRGLMVGETPNIDRLANEGGMFMDY